MSDGNEKTTRISKFKWGLGIFFILACFWPEIVLGLILFVTHGLSPLEPGESVRLEIEPGMNTRPLRKSSNRKASFAMRPYLPIMCDTGKKKGQFRPEFTTCIRACPMTRSLPN